MAKPKNNQYGDGYMAALNTLCMSCKHRDPVVNPYVCAAFPNGIPKAIFMGAFDHRLRWLEDGNEDNGITYEPKKEERG